MKQHKFDVLLQKEGAENEAVALVATVKFDQLVKFETVEGEVLENIYSLVRPYDELIQTYMESGIKVRIQGESSEERDVVISGKNGTPFPMGTIRRTTQPGLLETYIRIKEDGTFDILGTIKSISKRS